MALIEGVKADFTVARDREQFVSALGAGQFDLVLADSGLSSFDGLSALKMAREKFPDICFICVSGLADPAHIQNSLQAGATAYVLKDDLPELMAILLREQQKKQDREK